ncbi:hypothetical protein Vafri_4623 [Volvox africanus]|uniref:Metallo-beta-lactamase domain-containing protein n=1 Tax=Volvox africanus TaxID=51714 RepID=A0A8J4AW28_9CHLO|nr:hypothetical protein Vafri_4623 [Volvox africanus]
MRYPLMITCATLHCENIQLSNHHMLGDNRVVGMRHAGGYTLRPSPFPSRPRCDRRFISVPVSALKDMDLSLRRNEREKRVENVDGPFYVDRTCIDCDTCRWMAPSTFSRVGRQSAVVAQPEDGAARVQALRALISCPTHSIHVSNRSPEELKEAQEGLPARVPNVELSPAAMELKGPGTPAGTAATATADGVYYTGWASVSSIAACAYLIVRQGGNILVDVPRYSPVLARRIEALGGVRYIFMTHRDDVAGHQEWARHFGARRVFHELEVNTRQGTDEVEVKLSGEGPWFLDGDGEVVSAAALTGTDGAAAGELAAPCDLTFIFTPGHTEGHVCLYYAPYKVLFSGDHLCSAWGEVEGAPQDELFIYTNFNWYSVPEQLRSVTKLLQYDWLHVLPAHGRRAHFPDATARNSSALRLAAAAAPSKPNAESRYGR